MAFARAAGVTVAIISSAWFGLGIRQAHETTAANAIISPNPFSITPEHARRAAADLSSAATLNPDREVDVLRGALAVAEGQDARARKILRPVIRDEPKNLQAWIKYASAMRDQPRDFLAAQTAIRRLVKPFPPRR